MSATLATTAPRTGRPAPCAENTLPDQAWRCARMVRFSDCDPAGIGYTPRYVDMLNGVIEDFFPARLGLDYHAFITGGVGLGYASLHCDFFAPSRMGDQLSIAPLIDHIGGSSARLVLHVHRAGDEILRGTFTMVTTSAATGTSIPLPAPLRAAFSRYQEQCQ